MRQRAGRKDDCGDCTLLARGFRSSQQILGGADADGCIPLQPDSTRGIEQRDAVQTPLRQGRNPRTFRTIGARAFVNVETRGRKLDQRAWQGRLVGYSMDSTSYRVYIPATGTARESRNVIFIETPSAMPEPDLANGLEEG